MPTIKDAADSWESLEKFLRKIRDAFSTRNWYALAALWLLLAFFSLPQVAASLLKELKIAQPLSYDFTTWLVAVLLLLVLGIAAVVWLAPEPPPPPPPADVLAIKELRPFEFEDARVFAQLERQSILQSCLGVLRAPDFRFGILYSDSGSGKTSFLRAGLRPGLAGLHSPPRCIYVKFTDLPPLDAVRLAMTEELKLPPDRLSNATTFLGMLDELLRLDPAPLVLLFDQFEQYFLHLPGPLSTDAFARQLLSWHQQRLERPVKILVSIRADFMDRLMDLHKIVPFELGNQVMFRLEKFSPEQARNVLRVIAQQAGMAFDEDFVLKLAGQELADREASGAAQGRISPVNVQILAAMLAEQHNDNRAFAEAAFTRLGGLAGLMERFLEQKLQARLTPTRRLTALKVLLALTDSARETRAGVLTPTQIAEKSGLALGDAAEAVGWLEGARLLTAVGQGGPEQGYELAHERLIKPLLRLSRGSDILREEDRANQLLTLRVYEWLDSNRNPRLLLALREWWLISRHRAQLLWGEQRQQKEELLARTQQRWQRRAGAGLALALVAGLGWGWWQSESGVLQRTKWALHQLERSRPTDEPSRAWAGRAYLLDGKFAQALATTSKMNDPEAIDSVLLAAARGIRQLPDTAQARAQLTAVYQMCGAFKLSSHIAVLNAIAQGYGRLPDRKRALLLLAQTRTALKDSLREDDADDDTQYLHLIASTYLQMRDSVQALATLKQAQEEAARPLAQVPVSGSTQLRYGRACAATAAVYMRMRQPARAQAYMLDGLAQLSADDIFYGSVLSPIMRQAVALPHSYAITVLNATLPIVKKTGARFNYLLDLADAYRKVDLCDSAKHLLTQLVRTVDLQKPTPGYNDKVANWLSVGELYNQLHDTPRAKACFAQARVAASVASAPLRARLQLSVAAAYRRAADTAQARSMLATARTLIMNPQKTRGSKKPIVPKDRAYMLAHLSQAYLALADTAQARSILQEAQRLATEMSPGETQFGTFYYIAEGYEQLADVEQAARIISAALTMAEFIPAEDEKGAALSKLAQLATRLRHYKLAYAIIGEVPVDERAELLFRLLEAYQQQQTGHPRPTPKASRIEWML